MKDITNFAKELVMEPKFTVAEENARKRYITLLKNFSGMSVAVEKAIADIRVKKLFRPYKTLKEFLMEQCGWKSQRRAQQVIKFVEIKAALPPKSEQFVRTESQARALSRVPEAQRVEILEEAGKDGKITAKRISEAATKALGVDGALEASLPVTDGRGAVVPASARKIWDRRFEAKCVMDIMRAAKRAVNALDINDLMWCEVNLNGVLADLSAAINRFGSVLPEYVCPYCKGTTHTTAPARHGHGMEIDHCKACRGRGVMSKFMYVHAVPEEMKR